MGGEEDEGLTAEELPFRRLSLGLDCALSLFLVGHTTCLPACLSAFLFFPVFWNCQPASGHTTRKFLILIHDTERDGSCFLFLGRFARPRGRRRGTRTRRRHRRLYNIILGWMDGGRVSVSGRSVYSVCARRRNTNRRLNTRQSSPLWFYAIRWTTTTS